MTPLDYLAMFGSSFILVALLGTQSRNVIRGDYLAAAFTSAGISACNFMFVKYAVNSEFLAFLASATGGVAGICTAIWLGKRISTRQAAQKALESTFGAK